MPPPHPYRHTPAFSYPFPPTLPSPSSDRSTSTLYTCTTAPHVIPPRCPCRCPCAPELERAFRDLIRANADLEHEVATQYAIIDELLEQNGTLRRGVDAGRGWQQQQQQQQQQWSTKQASGVVEENERQTTTATGGAGAGLRLIASEMQILDLSSRVACVEMAVARLQTVVELLADDVVDHERCVMLLAGVLNEMDGAGAGAGAAQGVQGCSIRGGMGGREEDEEFVYGDGGYVDWDGDEMEGCEGSSSSSSEARLISDDGHAAAGLGEGEEEDEAQIEELRRQIGRLEEEVRRLRGLAELDVHASDVGDEELRGEELEGRDGKSEAEGHLHSGSGCGASLSPSPLPSPCHSKQPHLPDSNSSPTTTFTTFEPTYPHPPHSPNEPCPQCPPSACTEAWTGLATVLQLHNRFLERQLADYKDLCESLDRDVRWQMGTQVELEELAETAEQARDDAMAELLACNVRLQRALEEGVARPSSVAGSTVADVEGAARTEVDSRASLTAAAAAAANVEERDADMKFAAEPDTSHIPYTSFTYLPQQQLLLFPTSDPLQLFRFADGASLNRIHAALQHRQCHVGEDNPYLVRAREILDINRALGIVMPDVFEEEEVVIGIPEVVGSSGAVDAGVEIAAWRTGEEGVSRLGVDGDNAEVVDGEASFREMERGKLCVLSERMEGFPGSDGAVPPTSSGAMDSTWTLSHRQSQPTNSKNHGCEQWPTTTSLDRYRQHCTFCHLPFTNHDCTTASASTDSVAHDFDPPTPTTASAYDGKGNRRFTPWWARGAGM